MSNVLGPVRKRILGNLRDLKSLRMVTLLEAEIVARLLEGRRTAGELVEEIFDVQGDSESFHSYYMRVCRALHSLEKRGYVSTRLFGRDRPYRLTDHVVQRLARIGGEQPARLVPIRDALVYVVTVVVCVIVILARLGFLEFDRQGFMVLFTLGVLLSGVSLTKFLEMIGKVW